MVLTDPTAVILDPLGLAGVARMVAMLGRDELMLDISRQRVHRRISNLEGHFDTQVGRHSMTRPLPDKLGQVGVSCSKALKSTGLYNSDETR